jgi:hypothetical protein
MRRLNLLHPEGMRRIDAEHCIFILDIAYFKSQNIGKHKLKCLLDLCLDQKVEVYQGNTQEILMNYIEEHKIEEILLQYSHLSLYQNIMSHLQKELKVTLIEDPLLMHRLKLKTSSFFKFYSNIENTVKNID